MDEKLMNLNHCSLFNHLNSAKINDLFSKVQYSIKNYRRGEVIFCPHIASDTLGILLSGSVDVQKIFATGKALTVTRRYAHDLIAEASLFAKIDHYPSTIIACENTQALLIKKNEIVKLFTLDEIIMTKFLECVSNRILSLNHTIEILSLNSVTEKIVYYLLLEYHAQNTNPIQLKFTKKALAEHLNVSRTTLSRELKNLQQKGYISFEGRNIKIHCIEKFESLCSTN